MMANDGLMEDENGGNDNSNVDTKSSTGKRTAFEIHDDIAKKLLDGKFYLSALEFHTELVEIGKELPRLKEFFSNPANFEIQMKLDPFHSFRKTASTLTLDSIDDLARFSDDGHHDTDEKITVLEFELRKAKETIHELRENITKMTSDREIKENTMKHEADIDDSGFDLPINHYEMRTLNFLVNKYLLRRDYKLTSITFAEEVGDQDVDDWEDVGLNTGEPPDIVRLLRDFSRHDIPNEKDEEIEKLRKEVKALSEKCEKMNGEFVQLMESNVPYNASNYEKKKNFRGISDSGKNGEQSNTNEDNMSGDTGILQESIDVLSEKSPFTPLTNASMIANTSIELFTGVESDPVSMLENTGGEISGNSVVDGTDILHDLEVLHIKKDDNEKSGIITEKLTDQKNAENNSGDLEIANQLLPEQFLKKLYSDTCKKGISRLSKQVSSEDDLEPVQVITSALPNIIPNILLSKREEVIPLILCAVRYHKDPNVRDELLNMLFNLIKRPDNEQRRIIIDGCLSFATKVESSRIESELLPQCWEQINHKYAERRLLVSETCGSLSPCTSPDLLSSLVFSMLAQMLEEERNEEVRVSVIKNLSVIITYMIESGKYIPAYQLLERSLNDIVQDVITESKKSLLPVVGLWALRINKFRTHFLPQLYSKCYEALHRWYEGNISFSEGEADALILASDTKFNTYIDCLISLNTMMFAHCLQNAPFSDKDLCIYYDDKYYVFDESRLPVMKNPLFNLESLIGDEERVKNLVINFDLFFLNNDNDWNDIDWICNECILKVSEMSGLVFTNYSHTEKLIEYMKTVCKVFGKEFTFSRIVPFFETYMRNTGVPFLLDVPPVCSPLLAIFLCGVLASFEGKEHIKKLITFIKQCLLTISTQGLSNEFLIYSITSLCKSTIIQDALLNMLRETLVYPVSEVKMLTAVILEVLVRNSSKEIISTQLAPAIITLTNDREISVVVAAVPSLGSVMQSISDKSLLDKVILQLQTLWEDGEFQLCVALQKEIIKMYSKIVPNLDNRLRNDFFLPRLKTVAESSHTFADLADRLEVAEELIAAFSATLCCFVPQDIISNLIIPSLKHLENDLKDMSPETVDIVTLLLKDTENKIDDDKVSTGSGPSKIFGGISSRFDKFKKKPKDRDRSSSSAS